MTPTAQPTSTNAAAPSPQRGPEQPDINPRDTHWSWHRTAAGSEWTIAARCPRDTPPPRPGDRVTVHSRDGAKSQVTARGCITPRPQADRRTLLCCTMVQHPPRQGDSNPRRRTP